MTPAIGREDTANLLHEADCSDAFIRQFLEVMETGSIPDQLRLLRKQRAYQLERLHEEGKKLDQLDFLRYSLERQLPKPNRTK